MTYKEARDTLRELGKEIGKYSQSKRINANTALKTRVDSGMCAGAVLDWLHQVLCGGDAKQGPSDMGALVAFFGQKSANRNKFYNDRKAALNQAFNNQQNACNQDISALNQKVQEVLGIISQKPGMTQGKYDALEEEVMKRYNQEVADTKASYQGKMDRINVALKTENMHTAFWADFAKVMDSKLKTSYSKLTLAAASSSRNYGPPNGLLALLKEVIGHPQFHAGCGVNLGVGPVSPDPGHAVGIHRLNTGNYHLFDPNFGIYALDNLNLYKAILFLFLKAYPQIDDGSTPDSRLYEVKGQVNGDYLIYQGSKVVPQSVQMNPVGVTV